MLSNVITATAAVIDTGVRLNSNDSNTDDELIDMRVLNDEIKDIPIEDENNMEEEDLDNYDKNIIVGNKSIKPRLTKVPTIIPLPKKKHYVSIYELQKKITQNYRWFFL